ncbi:choice-of-anchor M domain-containing protein [Corynebacterium caspium]|uniref:choice-of-anchor M domain-containing protein n=1 Tax=Corynebacterium caspium TaxID=234828 RepID=UPI0003681BBF|nr:choice-of-anchor M domain-containing protein [Corynebacterium caspium]WKD58929.1 hypothetical protein CCASP_02610 [Corynebacterium caspium DSM 44850]
MSSLRRYSASVAAAALILAGGPIFVTSESPFNTLPTANAITACAANPDALGARTLITHGHQDMAISATDAGLHDDESGQTYPSGTFAVEVARELPYEADLGLPFNGWYLPQTQEQELPWLGFSASADVGRDATVEMTVDKAPGRVIIWDQRMLGDAATIVLDSQAPNMRVDFTTHVHYGFLFEKAGIYDLTFRVSPTSGLSQDIQARFLVGEDCDPGATNNGSSSSSSSTNNTSQLGTMAKDIKDFSQSIGAVDRALGTLDKTLGAIGKPVAGTNTTNTATTVNANNAANTANASRTNSSTNPHNAAVPAQISNAISTAPRGPMNMAAASSGAIKVPAASGANAGGAAISVKPAENGAGAGAGANAAGSNANPSGTPTAAKQVNASTSDIALKANPVRTSTFWVGILIGVGTCALLLGLALLLSVQLGRRNR